MNILIVHQNFPGQYPHLAKSLLDRGDRVVSIGGPTARELPGIPLVRYNALPSDGVPFCHGWASDFQAKCMRAEAVGHAITSLIDNGFKPDIVIGHPGWGELIAVKDLLPNVPVIHHVEYIYQMSGGDFGFDQEFNKKPDDWISKSLLRVKRAPQLLALQDLDWGWAPTRWQASTSPVEYREKIFVVHEGVNTRTITPQKECFVSLERAGIVFKKGSQLVSYVARSLEPYRGFHIFMRMLADLQQLRPDMHAIIVGSDGTSYGASPQNGRTWKQELLDELSGKLDLNRIHFVGQVPHQILHDLFRVTACHVYLTYPFVLSWSMLEAMACGALVVGSRTSPVEEVIRDGENGVLVDFFDHKSMASKIAYILGHSDEFEGVRRNARLTIEKFYDLESVCLPKQLDMIDSVA